MWLVSWVNRTSNCMKGKIFNKCFSEVYTYSIHGEHGRGECEQYQKYAAESLYIFYFLVRELAVICNLCQFDSLLSLFPIPEGSVADWEVASDCGSVAEDLGNEFDWILPQCVLEEPVVETYHQNQSNTQYGRRDQWLDHPVQLRLLRYILNLDKSDTYARENDRYYKSTSHSKVSTEVKGVEVGADFSRRCSLELVNTKWNNSGFKCPSTNTNKQESNAVNDIFHPQGDVVATPPFYGKGHHYDHITCEQEEK